MLNIINKYQSIITKWNVDIYEHETNISRFKASIYFNDNSLLRIKEYKFADRTRKYAYQWESSKGSLIIRWDNAPHWQMVPTHPHHKHIASARQVQPSDETNLESVLELIEFTIRKSKKEKR